MRNKKSIFGSNLERILVFDDSLLGPHARALLADLRGAAKSGLSLTVIVLSATLVDVIRHETAGPAGYLDGAIFNFAGNKNDLNWLRIRRNHFLHHEGPSDGLMGEVQSAEWLIDEAVRALGVLVKYLDDLF